MLERLNTAMMCELRLFCYSSRKDSKLRSLDICHGIVLSAYWLDLITIDDYMTIGTMLEETGLRVIRDD